MHQLQELLERYVDPELNLQKISAYFFSFFSPSISLTQTCAAKGDKETDLIASES